MITRLQCLVLEDGTPVSIHFDAETPDGSGAKAITDGDIVITKVGTPIVIKAPD